MLEALGTVPGDTEANIEKKQARTYEELQAEQAEAEQVREDLSCCAWGGCSQLNDAERMLHKHGSLLFLGRCPILRACLITSACSTSPSLRQNYMYS